MDLPKVLKLLIFSFVLATQLSAQTLEMEYRHKKGANLSQCNCAFMEIGDTVFMRIFLMESQMNHEYFRLTFLKDSLEEFYSEVIPKTKFVQSAEGRYSFERMILRRTSETLVARPTKICLYDENYALQIKLEGFKSKKKAKVKRFEKNETRPEMVLISEAMPVKVNLNKKPQKQQDQKSLGLTASLFLIVIGLVVVFLVSI